MEQERLNKAKLETDPRKQLEMKLKADLSKRYRPMVLAAAPFYYMRNFAFWISANMEIGDAADHTTALMQRAMIGFFSGAVSSIPDSFANKAMEAVANSPLEIIEEKKTVRTAIHLHPLEVARNGINQVFADMLKNPKTYLFNVLKVVPIRAIGGAISATLYSEEGGKLFHKASNEFAEIFKQSAVAGMALINNKEFFDSYLENFKEAMGDEVRQEKCLDDMQKAALQQFGTAFLENLDKEIAPDFYKAKDFSFPEMALRGSAKTYTELAAKRLPVAISGISGDGMPKHVFHYPSPKPEKPAHEKLFSRFLKNFKSSYSPFN